MTNPETEASPAEDEQNIAVPTVCIYTSIPVSERKKRKDGTTLSNQSPQAVDLRLSMIKEINFEDFVHRYKLDESPDNDRISAHEMRSK